MAAQLSFAWNELTGPYSNVLRQLRQTRTPADAATLFMNLYEKPTAGAANLANRIAQANAAFAAGFAGGGIVHAATGLAPAPVRRHTTSTRPAPKPKNKLVKTFKAKALPKGKSVKLPPGLSGPADAMLGNLNALAARISEEQAWQSLIQGLYGGSATTLVTDAQGNPVIDPATGLQQVNAGVPGAMLQFPEVLTGFVDPSTGLATKSIWDAVREIMGGTGQGTTVPAPSLWPTGPYASWNPNYPPSTTQGPISLMGMDEWLWSGYLEEQYLAQAATDLINQWLYGGPTAGQAKAPTQRQLNKYKFKWGRPTLPGYEPMPAYNMTDPTAPDWIGETNILAQWKQTAANLAARINRNVHKREELTPDRAAANYDISKRFAAYRKNVNAQSARARFDLTSQRASLLNDVTKEEGQARQAISYSAPAGWTGTTSAWLNQRNWELQQVTINYQNRRAAIEAAARTGQFNGSQSRTTALAALSAEAAAEHFAVGQYYDAKRISLSDLITGLRGQHTTADRQVTTLTTDINDVIGQGGTYSQAAAYLGDFGSAAQAIWQLQYVDVPGLQAQGQQLGINLKGPQSPAAAAGAAATPDALTQQLALTNAVLVAQYNVLSKLPLFAGSFQYGGVVPGPLGEARTVIAHGGEKITPPGAGGYEAHVHIGQGMDWLKNFIRAEVKSNGRVVARTGNLNLPGAGGGRLRVRAT
jgi:hypothetical protein